MSNSRTLLRKNKRDRDRRDLSENRRAKPGSIRRRVIAGQEGPGWELWMHATKGLRFMRTAR